MVAVILGVSMSEYIVKKLSKKIDLVSYKSSVLAFKSLSAYCKAYNRDIDDYQVVKRTVIDGVTHDEIVEVLE